MRKKLLFLLLLFVGFGIPLPVYTQQPVPSAGPVKIVKAKGTGRTTGHVITLTVMNTGKTPVTIRPQTAYIPSDGQQQPYVGTIPETTIPPGGSVDIPVDGYCADVYTPPAGPEDDLTTIENWIPVGDPAFPVPPGTVAIVPGPPRPPFVPGDIHEIISGPGFSSRPPDSGFEGMPTWPGTDFLVGGVMDPVHYPEVFGPVIVTALDHIHQATVKVLGNDRYDTPYGDSPDELSAVVQQTFWRYMAGVTGRTYTQDMFQQRVYDQFDEHGSMLVSKLPEDQKADLDEGITEFWNVFTAVGVEAKVLSPTQVQQEETPAVPSTPMARPVDTDCLCDSLTFRLVVRRENTKDNSRSKVIATGETTEVLKTSSQNKEISTGDWKEGDYYVISILDAVMKCHCQNSDGTSPDCDYYAASVVTDDRNKVQLEKEPETKQGEAENMKDVKEGKTIKKASRKDRDFKYLFRPKHKKGEDKVSITFCLSAVCDSKMCKLKNNKASCGPYCLTLDFKK